MFFFLILMQVFQWKFDYFFGAASGYGTVRTKYGNRLFSNIQNCKEDLDRISSSVSIKEYTILEYTLDSIETPIHF